MREAKLAGPVIAEFGDARVWLGLLDETIKVVVFVGDGGNLAAFSVDTV